ncbi:hypothetical protein BV25DRAFT_1916453 [Artomyces pyxidatus]|uniref:Uncharacterized protein n=1 Tax=Artomyces pyxidatus TaxID=48021 RepID=A0ACB8SZZ7_9AGAM|nr:hypothetical protein BV25DRAFT_1916453 [Artomyces pyxidatus]
MASSKAGYERNRTRRLQYQNNYNKVKRLGRRKISKAERTSRELWRKAELDGRKSKYTNTIACRSNTVDDRRTLSMAGQEETEWDEWSTLRADLIAKYADQYFVHYVPAVQEAINKYVCTAKEVLESQERPHAGDDSAVHSLRRIVAGLHQELEIHKQGHNAFISALQDRALIFQGRRVHRRVFKKIYGF